MSEIIFHDQCCVAF